MEKNFEEFIESLHEMCGEFLNKGDLSAGTKEYTISNDLTSAYYKEEGFKEGVSHVLQNPEIYGLTKQKPAEWSLTDATFIEEIDETLFMAETGRNEVVKNQIERERNWLKSLPERFVLQPKQEWSEEDEENFKWFDKFFRAESVIAGGRDIPQDKYLWLKSLRSRPKISDNWKPSEELIGCLERVIAFKNPEPEDIDGCESLIEQLKKLGVKEEPEYYQHFDPDC